MSYLLDTNIVTAQLKNNARLKKTRVGAQSRTRTVYKWHNLL